MYCQHWKIGTTEWCLIYQKYDIFVVVDILISLKTHFAFSGLCTFILLEGKQRPKLWCARIKKQTIDASNKLHVTVIDLK